MDAISQPDPAWLRDRQAYHHLAYTLRATLPPPLTDTPEAALSRDDAAIAQVAALCPATATEANLAAQYVAANAHAMDCLRLVHDPATPPDTTWKCRAQAAGMMRQAQNALRLLLRMQAAREKRDADTEWTERAAWAGHGAGELMAEALAQAAAIPPNPEPAAPIPAPEPPAWAVPDREPAALFRHEPGPAPGLDPWDTAEIPSQSGLNPVGEPAPNPPHHVIGAGAHQTIRHSAPLMPEASNADEIQSLHETNSIVQLHETMPRQPPCQWAERNSDPCPDAPAAGMTGSFGCAASPVFTGASGSVFGAV